MNTLENIVEREYRLAYIDNNKTYKLVCFGASIALNIVLEGLENMQITPDFICDNDKNKQGNYKNKHKIYSPEEVFSKDFDFLVIISSMYSLEIKEQLRKYTNIVFCEDYRYFLPSKIYKTDIYNRVDKLNIDEDLDFDVKISVQNYHASDDRFKGSNYLNYLSYSNQIIAEDRDDSKLYLCESKYNFNELNFKKILEYFIFCRYANRSKDPIVIDSSQELNKGHLLETLYAVTNNLSDEKFAFIRSTQSLKKRKEHALVWHLYHIDMFEEINAELDNCFELFDLYISINHECSIDDVKKILSVYPEANIFMFENRGRDVLPFLKIFREIKKLDYDSICKIHTKKSVHINSGLEWGKILRTRLFDGHDEILSSFKEKNKIGAYVAKGNLAGSSSVGLNKDNMLMTCDMLNIQYTEDFYFPIGTMFWCRSEAIYQLTSDRLQSKYFVIENGEIDGTFAHALERFIGLLIKTNGYLILEI